MNVFPHDGELNSYQMMALRLSVRLCHLSTGNVSLRHMTLPSCQINFIIISDINRASLKGKGER